VVQKRSSILTTRTLAKMFARPRRCFPSRVAADKNHLHQQSLCASVPRGTIHIRGDFIGTITTATHCLEVNLPLNYHVPNAALEPLVAAFIKAESVASDGHAHRKSHPKLAQVWRDLREMMMDAPDHGDRELDGKSNLADACAQDALIAELSATVDALKAENVELKHQAAALAEGSKTSDSTGDFGESEPETGCVEHGPQVFGDEEKASPGPAKVGVGSVWLNGSFSGIAQTQRQFIDITLPINGLVPAARALELLDGLAELAEGDGTSGQSRSTGTWGSLSEFLADVASETVVLQRISSAQDLHALKEQLANAIEDKRQLESEMANVQLQLESLRSTKSVEVGDGAMDAQSVVQLHSTLRQFSLPAMGVSPLRARHRTTPRPGSVLRMPSRDDVGPGVPDAYAASVANLQTLTRWAVCQ